MAQKVGPASGPKLPENAASFGYNPVKLAHFATHFRPQIVAPNPSYQPQNALISATFLNPAAQVLAYNGAHFEGKHELKCNCGTCLPLIYPSNLSLQYILFRFASAKPPYNTHFATDFPI